MRIHAAGALLDGELDIPSATVGMVVFAHDSPRDREIAGELRKRGMGTLLVDLLGPEEDEERRFDVDLLSDRLIGVLRWLRKQPVTKTLPVGLFGAGIDAGAAVVAAASRPGDVQTVVARGGRPDLAGGALAHLTAPTLLIVGERDPQLRVLNEQARKAMRAHAELCVIPDASRFFPEPGALELVAAEAGDWLAIHLTAPVADQPKTVDSALL